MAVLVQSCLNLFKTIRFRALLVVVVGFEIGCSTIPERRTTPVSHKLDNNRETEIGTESKVEPEPTIESPAVYSQPIIANDRDYAAELMKDDNTRVWGVAGFRGFPYGEHVAANGVEFKQLFSMDLDLNLWINRDQRVYGFFESRFWGQKPGAGLTNPTQGSFDFSKREFDLITGVAWNYSGNWEARLSTYAFSNLNRGKSTVSPSGFNDGTCIENRYYLSPEYGRLGTNDFDISRNPFLAIGYYPSKTMIDGNGDEFKPGAFVRASLTFDLQPDRSFFYVDTRVIAQRYVRPKLLMTDFGVAFRPLIEHPRLEFRIGSEDVFDLQKKGDHELSAYLSFRYRF